MNEEKTGLELRLQRLSSRADIVELGAKYCSGIDRHDLPLFLSIWHAEGEYVIGRRSGRFKGIDELSTALEFVRKSFASTHHWTTNHIITWSGNDVASGRSDSFALCVDESGAPSMVSASYDDVYERVDGVWLIRSRAVRRWLMSDPVDVRTMVPASIQ